MHRLFMIFAAFALASCATGYQPAGFAGGFSEIQLNSDTYQIKVRGNGYTSRDRAYRIALLRAAELTLNSGADRFVILSGGTSTNYAGSTPVTAQVIGNTLIATGGDAIFKPESGLLIRIVKPSDPNYASAMDARLIDAQLRPALVGNG